MPSKSSRTSKQNFTEYKPICIIGKPGERERVIVFQVPSACDVHPNAASTAIIYLGNTAYNCCNNCRYDQMHELTL